MKLLLVAFLAVFMISCQSRGVMNEIKQRYLSQQTHTVVPAQSGDTLFIKAVDPQFQAIVSFNGSTYAVKDSVYKIEPTWGQAIETGKHDSSLTIFIFGFVVVLAGLLWYYKKSQDGTRTENDKSVLAWLIIPFVGLIIMGGAFGWDKWNAEREILKSDYQKYQLHPGGLDEFWKTTPKIY